MIIIASIRAGSRTSHFVKCGGQKDGLHKVCVNQQNYKCLQTNVPTMTPSPSRIQRLTEDAARIRFCYIITNTLHTYCLGGSGPLRNLVSGPDFAVLCSDGIFTQG
jgi:hypothetical protein